MTFKCEAVALQLREAFRIAHGSSLVRTNTFVQVGGVIGEAALPPYYPTRHDHVVAYVEGLQLDLPPDGYFPIQEILTRLPTGPLPAIAAIDMALHDLWGRRLGHPLYRLLGLNGGHIPPSFLTISLPQTLEDLEQHLQSCATWPRLKLKLGSGDPAYDEAVVRRTRRRFTGVLSVDVNGGWSLETALTMIPALADCNLAFIEEPVSFKDPDDWHLLRRMLPRSSEMPALFADESVQTEEDVLALAGAADGVNLKLAKCGGLARIQRIISLARSLDLKIMIGCMIESSLAITAAAHLGPLADFLDLDAQLLVANDPFRGVTLENGLVTLPAGPGLGVRPASV